MKGNLRSRITGYQQELDKFSARWHQLKPQGDVLDSNKQSLSTTLQSLKEKRTELDELEKAASKLW